MNHVQICFLKHNDRLYFPPISKSDKSGLLAVGGDLSNDRLLLAYSSGIFPWYNSGSPIMWWSPDPRCVLFPHEFHLSKSLKKLINQNKYDLTVDNDFANVIKNCAITPRKNQTDTWILPEMVLAYQSLHHQGFAHSFEALDKDKKLVGGIYGVSLGRIFFAESMFFTKPNASKFVMYSLVIFCLKQNFALIDCQIANNHLLSLGARQVKRQKFLQILSDNIKLPSIRGSWSSLNPMLKKS